MNKLCVFAGTTEGRILAERLSGQAVELWVCVATEYGSELLPQAENLRVLAGRLTAEEMAALFRREAFGLVVNATHPYASAATENIRQAAEATGTEYLRLLRRGGEAPAGAVYVPDAAAAAAYLDGTEGTVLLTTGSKELAAFRGVRGFRERFYARVLPLESSLAACREAGLEGRKIIAMQGPFSRELNEALIHAVGAEILVTKDSGAAGGFPEKAEAAEATECRLVVIGRPPQAGGADLAQTARIIEEKFGLHLRPKVTIVGTGTGSRGELTEEARRAIREADCLIGSPRLLEAFAEAGKLTFAAVAPEKIRDFLEQNPELGRAAVLMSGDTGFYSGTRKLLPLLAGWDTRVLPGISSLSALCARLGESYEDVACLSLHGRDGDLAGAVRRSRRVFVLTGGEGGISRLCARLTAAGLGGVRVSVGEDLGSPGERITRGTAAELAGREFRPLAVALAENPNAQSVPHFGLPDDAFARAEGVPMTKSEVRAVVLSKLAVQEGSVCWDIGAGTGSVTVELALAARQVYAVEREGKAFTALAENIRRFGLENVTAVSGEAPGACLDLPAPTHVFVGGSGGRVREILALAAEKNPAVRIVATAVTLETAAELTAAMGRFASAEAVCLSIARGQQAGKSHLMAGQNPVYLFTMEGRKA